STQNTFERGQRVDRLKIYFFGLLTFFFWAGLLLAGYKLMGRLAAEEPFGALLVHKLLGFLFMIFFAVLVFSNIVTCLNTLYLSDDLYMLITSPIAIDRLFLSRTIQAGALSSWMVLLFALPIMISAGIVFNSPTWFYPWMAAVLAIFLILPAALGAIVTTVLVKAFPARKTQDVLVILAIVFVVAIYFLIRFLQPEQLFNPDLFHGFTEYFATLRAPDSPLIPSVWATEAIWAGLRGQINTNALFMAAFGLSTGLAGIAVAAWVADRWYHEAYSKSQEGRKARFSSLPIAGSTFETLAAFARPLRRLIIVKDMKSFFRETTQWTQLLLLLALVVVYLFNFKVLRLEQLAGNDFWLRNIVAYVNLILAGFVLSAICVRFLLPAVSTEGRAFWILRAAPIKMRDVVLAKFFMFLLPIIIIGQMLVVVSNYFLRTHEFLMWVSGGLMFLCSIMIAAMAVGVGSIMPNFDERNVARMATGASSIVYMVAAMAVVLTVVSLAFWPGRIAFLAIVGHKPLTPREWSIVGICSALILAIVLTATILPLRWGIRALENREG
ncbi:MAG: putative ABC transporter permease subunit, partial [Alphaproteobacteria bacterium]